MEGFGWEVLGELSKEAGGKGEGSGRREVVVDIGVTKWPYFVDKARAVEGEEMYQIHDGEREGGGTKQVHLIGYDTLTRLLSPKYYPPEHKLDSLIPFLERHRLEVTYRTGGSWGDRAAQDGFLEGMANGKLLVKDGMAVEGNGEEGSLGGVGGRAEWVFRNRIAMVEGRGEGEEVVSSTKVREAVKTGDEEALWRLVTQAVGRFVLERGLYLD